MTRRRKKRGSANPEVRQSKTNLLLLDTKAISEVQQLFLDHEMLTIEQMFSYIQAMKDSAPELEKDYIIIQLAMYGLYDLKNSTDPYSDSYFFKSCILTQLEELSEKLEQSDDFEILEKNLKKSSSIQSKLNHMILFLRRLNGILKERNSDSTIDTQKSLEDIESLLKTATKILEEEPHSSDYEVYFMRLVSVIVALGSIVSTMLLFSGGTFAVAAPIVVPITFGVVFLSMVIEILIKKYQEYVIQKSFLSATQGLETLKSLLNTSKELLDRKGLLISSHTSEEVQNAALDRMKKLPEPEQQAIIKQIILTTLKIHKLDSVQHLKSYILENILSNPAIFSYAQQSQLLDALNDVKNFSELSKVLGRILQIVNQQIDKNRELLVVNPDLEITPIQTILKGMLILVKTLEHGSRHTDKKLRTEQCILALGSISLVIGNFFNLLNLGGISGNVSNTLKQALSLALGMFLVVRVYFTNREPQLTNPVENFAASTKKLYSATKAVVGAFDIPLLQESGISLRPSGQ